MPQEPANTQKIKQKHNSLSRTGEPQNLLTMALQLRLHYNNIANTTTLFKGDIRDVT